MQSAEQPADGSASTEQSEGGSSLGQQLTQFGLLALVICIWGTTDQISSGMARRIQLYSVIITNLFGVMIVLCAGLAYTSWVQPVGSWGPFSWTHAMYVGSNALAIWAWFLFVRLGKQCEASIFVPIVGSYPTATALLSVAILGESMTWVKVGGLLLTLAAIGALGWSDAQSKQD